MKKIITLILLSSSVVATFGYTSIDVSQANYLASKKIIKDWSSNPVNYRFDDYIARSEIMGMVLAMAGVTRNPTCRGDFADVPKSNIDWVCRTIETAADHGYINAQKNIIKSQRKARPYDHITRAEALGILMKAHPDDRGWAGYGYYWGYNFPVDGQTWGYESAYDFRATWQASVFYSYIRQILDDTAQLWVPPRPNDNATRREVFDFAAKIDKKINSTTPANNITCLNTLYQEDIGKYNFFESKFFEIFPQYSVYDAGAYCSLPNGNQLVSYSLFTRETDIASEDARQVFALFDAQNNFVRSSALIYCKPAGDVSYFEFSDTSILNRMVVTCKNSDGPYSSVLTYELDGETLYTKYISTETSSFN